MPVQNTRKQAVSLRLKVSDINRIKRLAERIGASESDVIRYAVKVMLARLSPLCDPAVRGRSLVPMFINSGVDILHHFALDQERLEEIINGDAPSAERIDSEDLQLMALMGVQRDYARVNLRQMQKPSKSALTGNKLDDTLTTSFRRHLYSKYVEPGLAADGERAEEAQKPTS